MLSIKDVRLVYQYSIEGLTYTVFFMGDSPGMEFSTEITFQDAYYNTLSGYDSKLGYQRGRYPIGRQFLAGLFWGPRIVSHQSNLGSYVSLAIAASYEFQVLSKSHCINVSYIHLHLVVFLCIW